MKPALTDVLSSSFHQTQVVNTTLTYHQLLSRYVEKSSFFFFYFTLNLNFRHESVQYICPQHDSNQSKSESELRH